MVLLQRLDVPQTQATAQIDLLEALLTTLGSAGYAESAAQDLTRQAHSRVVRSAEDYVLSHTTEHLYVTDLCEAAGVSERTLQYAFKEVMGMTPVAYLTRLRLHQVRHALRAATQASTTVTTEALRWASGTLATFPAPTRTASASCHRTPYDGIHMLCSSRALRMPPESCTADYLNNPSKSQRS